MCHNRDHLKLLLFVFSFALLLGCKPKEQVHTYEYEDLEPTPPVIQETPKGSDVMLAALVPKGDVFVWSFKWMVPESEQDEAHKTFVELLSTIHFRKSSEAQLDIPEWTAPSGWETRIEQNRESLRYASITSLDPGIKQQISVVPIPRNRNSIGELLLENYNRWRRQMGYQSQPQLMEMIESALEIVETQDSKAYILTLVGKYTEPDMMGPKRPKPSDPEVTSPRTPSEAAPQERTPFVFKLPANWRQVLPGPMVQDEYQAENEEGKARITFGVYPYTPGVGMGDLKLNLNRWRGQLGLAPVEEEEVESAFEKVDVAEVPSRYLALDSGSNTSPAKAIRVAMVILQDKIWFIKIEGATDLVQNETETFKNVLNSMQLRPKQEEKADVQ